MPTPTLVGSAEAAKILQIGPTNFSHLRKKMLDAGDDHFPTPIARLQCGPIWLEKDVLKFKKHYDVRRRRVRPSNGDAPVAETPKATKAAVKAPAKTRTPRAKATNDKATVSDIKTPRPRRKLVMADKVG